MSENENRSADAGQDNQRFSQGSASDPDVGGEAPPEGNTPPSGVESTPDDGPAPTIESSVETQLLEAQDKYLRLAAELENYKKRVARERSESIRFANERVLKEFLAIVDNLERALHHAGEAGETGSLMQGMELVHKQCLDLLARFNVTTIESMGVPFDPMVHQAMSKVETGDHPENTVAVEFQKGYRLHDRLLRPALVAVAVPKKSQPTGDLQVE